MSNQDTPREDHAYPIPEAAKAITNPKHAIFVAEMILHGDRGKAYRKAYPRTGEAAVRPCAARLLTRPEVAAAIRQGLWEIREAVKQQSEQRLNCRLTAIEEKRAVLAAIIRGELVTEKEQVKNGEVHTLKLHPDARERMRAILLDNELEEEWKRITDLPDKFVNIAE